jgi:hypothetical protein
MPLLDHCITSVYEPGNIGASSGEPPTIIRPGTLYDPDDYPADDVEWSMNYTRFYDSAYVGAF